MAQVLFLSASPTNIKPLPLGPEIRDAMNALNDAGISTAICPAMRPSDLHKQVLREEPVILHFSGHGEETKGIVIHAEDHTRHGYVARADARLDGRALKAFLKDFNHHLRLVFLNACYSSDQADAIAQAVDCVVAVDATVGNNAASTFASKFYTGLAQGRSVGQAFKAARGYFRLVGQTGDDPFRLIAPNTDTAQLFVFQSRPAMKQSTGTRRPTPRQTVAISPWHPVNAEDLGVAEPKLTIDVAPGTNPVWHTASEPGSADWRTAWSKLDAGLDLMSKLRGNVDVFASMGYAFAAATGVRISNMAKQTAAYWQLEGPRGHQRWTRYGTAVDHDDPVLYDISAAPAIDSRPVVLMVGITHDLEFRAVAHGLQAAGIESHAARLISFGPLSGASYEAIGSAAAAQQAANDLLERVYQLQTESPLAEIHLFFSGPAAILMMASGPWTTLASPFIVHERGSDRLYRPAICLYNRESTLLPGEVPASLRAEWHAEQHAARTLPSPAVDAGANHSNSASDDVVRAIYGDLLGDGAYAVKKSVFNWNDWALALFNGPTGVLKQLKMLADYRKQRVELTETQARIVIALLDQPNHMASAAMLEAALGARYGLTAAAIEDELVQISALRRADGAPADIVVRDGDGWRAVDL